MSKDKSFDTSVFTKEEQQFIKDRKLKDQFFIGRFNATKSGYTISDIRRSDFSKIKYKPSNKKAFTIEMTGYLKAVTQDDAYYRFTWKTVSCSPNFVFTVDTRQPIEPVQPKDIVNLLYEDIYDYPASASEKIVNTLDTLKNQLTASGKEVFIYELLQNANDYPQKRDGKKQPVDVEFHITDNYLIFQHSGDYFDAKNIAAICSINDKEKTDNAEAIGYKGIGFKTVFLDNNYVLLRTGDYQFRFDYEKTKNIDDTPWQILPIWTEDQKVDEEVLDVMDYADEKYRVQIALRPIEHATLHTSEQNYEELFAKVFDTERVILFIPFINSVSVYVGDEETPSIVRVKENDKWCVSESNRYVGEIPEELTAELNRRIDRQDGKIPEKYYDFCKTSIGFACRREGNKLIPVENSCLYCYLPAKKAKLGFGFLMNTDMIPTGPRDNVEPKERINHAIAKIAGGQFFNWIHDLLDSGKYDYDSVFSLIPDFEELEDKYEDDEDVLTFIDEFKEGFEEALEDGDIVPVINEEGQTVLMPVSEVNYDVTGITCSGIVSDKKLLKLTEWKDCFVHPALRDKENLCLKPHVDRFMECYVADGYTFDEDVLLDYCEGKDFSEWLSEEDNNNAFLDFLVKKEYLTDFKGKTIFLTETDKELMAAINIYYDIDKYYADLVAFDDYLPRLAMCTRQYFEGNEAWKDVKNNIFKEFDADDFVDGELLCNKNIQETKTRLEEPKASYGFYNFLANNVGYSENYKALPVIGFNETVIEDFNRTVYFYDKDGEELYDSCWTEDTWVNLISEEYSEEAKAYFKEHFGVRDFSVQSFIDDVLLVDEDIKEALSELGQEHIDFVHYCYAHKDCFKNRSMKNFSLWTYDKDGNNDHVLSEDVIFFSNALFETYQKKVWIQNEWMYKLDEDYFKGIDKEDDFRTFLSSTFGVLTFTQESFYKNAVSCHAADICENVGGTKSDADTDESIDILKYLGENYKLIFEEEGSNRFAHLPLFRYNVWDEITDRDTDVYLYNEDLRNLIEAEWTPEEFVFMLEERYQEVFSQYPALRKKLEIKTYSFKSIKDILLNDTDALNESIEDKEQNISFHRFFVENKDELNKSDYKKIGELTIYAVNKDNEESIHDINEALYIADVYLEDGKGMESMVKKYDETAFFVSDAYLSDDADDQEEEAWKEYFIALGINSDNKDIIFNSVLPNLADIKEKNIVTLLAQYYDFFHEDGVWENALENLKHLNVVTKKGDDEFLPLKDALFNDCNDSEPFPYLVIDDEIASFYHQSPYVMRLLREIVDGSKEEGSNIYRSFKDVDEWKKEKLDWYLNLQKFDRSRINEVHTRFIYDLAKDYTSKSDVYTKVKVKDILLLGKDKQYHKAKELTEGTAYGARCNFEKYNLPLTYVSEDYLPFENPDPKVFGKLFQDMDVVYDFHIEHLPYMRSNYKFTVYFWTEYLTQFSNRTHIIAQTPRGTIASQLNNYATIPTSNRETKEVCKPEQLYNQGLIQRGFVKGKVRNYADKMPLESIFSTEEVSKILNDLKFSESLSFGDCLECLLHTKDKDKRKDVLSWLAQKHSIDNSAISAYLNDENSKWRNGSGEFVRLQDLFVLHIDEYRLRQRFGKSARVMSQEYIDSSYVFEKFCQLFRVKPLTEDDFVLTPDVIKEPTTEEMQQKLRLPLLITAAVSEPDNWKELYDEYCEKIDTLTFHRCNSISFNYENVLKDSSIQFYKKGNVIYFVADWMGRRVFKDFVFEIEQYLDIDMERDMLESIFEADETNQGKLIDEYVSYELGRDTKFISTLKDLNSSIAEGVHGVYEEDEDQEEDLSSYGTNIRAEGHDGESYDEDEEENKVEDETEDIVEGASDDSTTSQPKPGDSTGLEESSPQSTVTSSPTPTPPDETDSEEEEDTEEEDVEDDELEENEDLPDEVEEEGDDEEVEETSHSTEENSTTPSGNSRSSYAASGSHSTPSSHSETGSSHLPRKEQEDYPRSTASGHSSGQRNYEETDYERPSRQRSYGEKRNNYMGYDPDETKHRPFNVGHQKPTTLETKEATEDEVARLSALFGRAFDKDSIVDENYLVRMRFYNSVKKHVGELKMSERDFIEKGGKYVQTKSGKYVHRCSARGGILYVSPTIWNRVKYDNCIICMYYGKKANQFLYIRSQKELMEMIDQDAVVVQVTGNDKGAFINKVYDSKFPDMKGNIYTMIRTIKTSGDDFIFCETDNVVKNDTDFDPDLV